VCIYFKPCQCWLSESHKIRNFGISEMYPISSNSFQPNFQKLLTSSTLTARTRGCTTSQPSTTTASSSQWTGPSTWAATESVATTASSTRLPAPPPSPSTSSTLGDASRLKKRKGVFGGRIPGSNLLK
jgi:hypothetical protein